MTTVLMALVGLAVVAWLVLRTQPASAHCDTLDGPAVAAGRRALDSGNLNHALVWVGPDAEAELRDVFDAARRVRSAGGEAADLADRLFLETLVRLHRLGEGAAFDGLKPAGTTDAAVVAADKAIETGSTAPLVGVVAEDEIPKLDDLLQAALALRDYPVDDVDAGRRYLAAYVAFVKHAEADPEHCGHDAGAHESKDHACSAHSHQH